ILRSTVQRKVRQGSSHQRRDGVCLQSDLLPRPGDRESKVDGSGCFDFRRIAGTGVRECTRWQSQGRRKESSCLAVAAYRSSQTRWPPLRSVEIGRLGPSAAVGFLPLSKQDLRLHRQAGARPPEETVERGEEPVGNDQFVTR